MIKVNGQKTESVCGISLTEFLLHRGYKIERIATELNERIVPKQEYDSTILEENDTLEIVNFMGGG